MRIVLVNGITFVMWADRLIVYKGICFGTIIRIPPHPMLVLITLIKRSKTCKPSHPFF